MGKKKRKKRSHSPKSPRTAKLPRVNSANMNSPDGNALSPITLNMDMDMDTLASLGDKMDSNFKQLREEMESFKHDLKAEIQVLRDRSLFSGGRGGGGLLNEEKSLAKKLWPSLLKDPKNSDPPLTPFKKIVTLPKDKIVKQLSTNITQSLFWQSNFNNTDIWLSMSCMFYQIWLYTGCHLFVLPRYKHLFRHHYLRR